MRKTIRTMVLTAALAALAVGAAEAKTLKWGANREIVSLDPYSYGDTFTLAVLNHAYEGLVRYNDKLEIEPALATSWELASPTVWRFKLRQGVSFHDGAPFTADDVLASLERVSHPTSPLKGNLPAYKSAKKIDEHTVDIEVTDTYPLLLNDLTNIYIFSAPWLIKNNATLPTDAGKGVEGYPTNNANGTGPFRVESRKPDAATVFVVNPKWWDKPRHNLTRIEFLPIASAATRVAALLSGEVDFVIDPPTQDVARLSADPAIKVMQGAEMRVQYLAFDLHRDELLYGSLKNKNPFKDLRVRKALYHAIDIETLRSKLMNGLAMPTGSMTPSPIASFNDAELEKRMPYDLALARKLMAEAGYADGFEVTLDCPNNRYINDEEICIALAGMWSQLKVKVRVNAMPRVNYFPKLEKFDTSMYMLGWGGSVTDAETTFTPVMRNVGEKGVGSYNYGRHKDDKFDALAAQSSVEADPAKREQLIRAALKEFKEQVHTLPLHRQVIPWAARQNVNVVHRADNWLEVDWVTINNK